MRPRRQGFDALRAVLTHEVKLCRVTVNPRGALRENEAGTPGIDCTSEPARPGACPLCGARNGPVVLREGNYLGRSCHCGTVYIDPRPDAAAVDPGRDYHLEDYYALPAQLRLDWVQRFQPRGRLLDVGCGNGSFVAAALARGYEVEALDPNRQCTEHVAARYRIPVHTGYVEDAAMGRDYDAVFHVDLLSHFPDPALALRRMAAMLRLGGTLCFEVGIFGGLPPRWYAWIGRPGFPAHRQFYSEDAVRMQLRHAGLEVVAVRRFHLGASAVLSTLLRRLLPDTLQSVPASGRAAARGNALQRFYARTHFVLRYRLGAGLRIPGPMTLLVAARPPGGAIR